MTCEFANKIKLFCKKQNSRHIQSLFDSFVYEFRIHKFLHFQSPCIEVGHQGIILRNLILQAFLLPQQCSGSNRIHLHWMFCKILKSLVHASVQWRELSVRSPIGLSWCQTRNTTKSNQFDCGFPNSIPGHKQWDLKFEKKSNDISSYQLSCFTLIT